MKHIRLTLIVIMTTAIARLAAAESEEGFVSIFDGKTFNGWKTAKEHPETWKVEDGALVAFGERCHLFYVGDEKPFKDFELKVEVMTTPGSNGGIYFHTKYQDEGWPKYGFESQVNCTHGDWIKTGSLYGLVNVSQALSKDNQWWTQHIIVKGNQVTVKVDDKIVLQYTEPAGAQPGKDFTRKIDSGTFAFQGHDPKSKIQYRNVRVKRLN